MRQAFLDQGVIVMRDQPLAPEAQIAFAARFGPLMGRRPSMSEKALMPGHPEIVILSNRRKNGEYVGLSDAGRYWHSDLCFEEKPNLATVLHAVEVPTNTLFTWQSPQVAWACLPVSGHLWTKVPPVPPVVVPVPPPPLPPLPAPAGAPAWIQASTVS